MVDGTTVWSVTYSMTSGEVRLAMGRKYDQVKPFRLPLARRSRNQGRRVSAIRYPTKAGRILRLRRDPVTVGTDSTPKEKEW